MNDNPIQKMPTLLLDLRQTTTEIEITRGKVKFELECALEKFLYEARLSAEPPTEGVSYPELRAESIEAEIERDSLKRELQSEIMVMRTLPDLDALRAAMQKARAPQAANKSAIKKTVVTDEEVKAEFTTRLAASEQRCKDINERIDANAERIKRACAKRLAYLVAGSGLINADGTPCLSGKVDKTPEELTADTEVFFKNFTDLLLDHCLEQVEGAVGAPLTTTG